MEASRLHISPARAHAGPWPAQLRWFAAAAVIGFTVPFAFSGLQHDVYLAIWFAAVIGLFSAYAVATGLDLGTTVRRHWKLGVGLGVVFGIALVRNVFSEDSTPHPSGAYYWFELLWRGGIYGAVDAILLTVIPCLIVFRGMGEELGSWSRRLAYFGVSLVLVLTITAIYHLGYSQYRQDGVKAPETGNAIISLPMLLSTNPLGSIIDHSAMHISAVAHSYETEVRLPPATKVD